MSPAATTSTDESSAGRGGAAGTVAPSGSSVWDIDPPVPAAARVEPVSEPSAPTVIFDPSAPAPTVPVSESPAPTVIVDPPPAADQHIRREVPGESGSPRNAPTASTRPNRAKLAPVVSDQTGPGGRPGVAGLIAVCTLALAIVAGAGWFLSSGVDAPDARASGAQAAPTLPPTAVDAALAEFESPTNIESPDFDAGAASVASTPPATLPVAVEVEEPAEPEVTVVEAATADPEPLVAEPDAESAESPPATPDPTPGPWIEITASNESCRFGSSCLVAGFTLHEFEVVPGSFVCEFANGARHEFRASSATVDYACATGSPGDSITIEVGGVRSETVDHG